MARTLFPIVAVGSVAALLTASLMLNAEDKAHDHGDHAGHEHHDHDGHDHGDHAGHDHGTDAAVIPGITPQPAVTYPEGFEEQTARVSYAIGADLGGNFKRMGVALDPKMVAQGVADTLTGEGSKLTPEQLQATMMAFQQELMAKRAAEEQARAGQEKRDLAAFLDVSKGPAEYTTTESGLQYRVLAEGEGASPTASSNVRVHYHGTLPDGSVFDSSVERGQAVEFPVGGVIPGWTEALQLMKVGSRYELKIPSKLAYGEQGAGDRIPPNTDLVFMVELLSFQ